MPAAFPLVPRIMSATSTLQLSLPLPANPNPRLSLDPLFPPSWPLSKSLAPWVVPPSYFHHPLVWLPLLWPGCNVLSLGSWKSLRVTPSLLPQIPFLQSFVCFQPEWLSPVRPIVFPCILATLNSCPSTILALFALLLGPSNMPLPQPKMPASPSYSPPFTWLICHHNLAVPSSRNSSLVEYMFLWLLASTEEVLILWVLKCFSFLFNYKLCESRDHICLPHHSISRT